MKEYVGRRKKMKELKDLIELIDLFQLVDNKMLTIYRVSLVLFFIKILYGSRNF
jgi:hypothetical protein